MDAFDHLTRIQYMSENAPHDGRWGEHEIDHCLVIQRDVQVEANWNEVKSYEYLSQGELKDRMGRHSYKPDLFGVYIQF